MTAVIDQQVKRVSAPVSRERRRQTMPADDQISAFVQSVRREG